MIRIILVYGCIAGLIVSSSYYVARNFEGRPLIAGVAVGYLVMLVALSFVFVGVRKYRDEHLGGVIRFTTALGVGAGISGVACLFYVLGWEVHLYATGYRFAPAYAAGLIEAKQAAGVSPAELARFRAEMAGFVASYANPLYRALMTLTEIAPVAVLVTLISALLLRNSRFMPARAA